jgi:demethylmenaquinone methyltransferase/2-methoxy-6-polyprenyl-1,4-benzoquinol methylase
MLRQAAEKIKTAGRENQICLLRGDGTNLPLGDETFAAVFISFTLELFDTPEIPAVLAEVKRVLQPGGRLAVVSLTREQAGFAVEIYEIFHDIWPALLDCRPIQACTALHEASFKIIAQTVNKMWGLPVEIVLAEKS